MHKIGKSFSSKLENFFNFFRNNFSATKQEVVIAIFLFSGLLVGVIIRELRNNNTSSLNTKEIARIVDSLAKIENLESSGTDIYGNPVDTSKRVQAGFFFSKLKYNDSVKINLNTASRVELMRIPGIGEKTAQAILDLRSKKKLRKPEDLLKIKGFGKKRLEQIKHFIIFE